jgi:hypothetical protein
VDAARCALVQLERQPEIEELADPGEHDRDHEQRDEPIDLSSELPELRSKEDVAHDSGPESEGEQLL